MQILVIAGFVVTLSLADLPALWSSVPWWAASAGAAGYVASSYVLARGSAYFGLRRLMRGHGGLGAGPMAAAVAVQVYLLAGLGVLMPAGWARLIDETLHLGGVPLVGKALLAAPFIAALLAYWWAMYPLQRAMRDRSRQLPALAGEPVPPVWTRGQFLMFNIRHSLLFAAVPVGLIVLVLDSLYLAEPLLGPAVAPAGLVAAGAVFVSAPAIIARIWRTGPLPAGPLRSRLDGLCRRAGFTCRDILVWDTGRVIVNAAVLGFLRPLRYVLLSDAMLEHFDDDAVAAIFAHEAGHVVHRHIPYMVLFTMGLILLLGSAAELSAAAMNISPPIAQLSMLLVAGALWAWLFGIVSRRFERQADVFAAALVPADSGTELTDEGVRLFSGALLKVGRLNGIDPARRNFRHGSIKHRLEYLDRLLRSGAGRAPTDRGVRRVKLAIWALLAAGIGAAVASVI